MLLLPLLLAAALPITAMPLAAIAIDNSHKPQPGKKCPLYGTGISQRDALAGYFDAVWVRRDLDEFATYVNPDLILHDQYTGDGVAASIQGFKDLGFDKDIVTFQNAIPPCGGTDRGVLHYKFVTPPDAIPMYSARTYIGMEIYRFDGPCIAETWVLYTEKADNATSSHPYFNNHLTKKPVLVECQGE